MVRPAVHAWLEEGAVDDQLAPSVEKVTQARLTFRPVELVGLLYHQPRHPPALGGQRVARAGQRLLLDEKLLARSLPLLRRHDRGVVFKRFSPVLQRALAVAVHDSTPVLVFV